MKEKSIICFISTIFLCISSQCFSQNTFNLKAGLTPSLTFMHIKDIGVNGHLGGTGFGASFNLSAGKNIGTTSEISLGAEFLFAKYHYPGWEEGALLESDIMAGTISQINVDAKVFALEIPVIFKQYFSNEKKFYTSLGVGYHRVLKENQDQKLLRGDGTIVELMATKFDIKTNNLVGYFSLGYDWVLNSKMTLSLSPLLKYQFFSNYFPASRDKVNFYSIGLAASLLFF